MFQFTTPKVVMFIACIKLETLLLQMPICKLSCSRLQSMVVCWQKLKPQAYITLMNDKSDFILHLREVLP
jgi:hypothetical protein